LQLVVSPEVCVLSSVSFKASMVGAFPLESRLEQHGLLKAFLTFLFALFLFASFLFASFLFASFLFASFLFASFLFASLLFKSLLSRAFSGRRHVPTLI
jgi:hypothetical protein